MMGKKIVAVGLLIIIFLASSCGYKATKDYIYLPDNVSKVYVENPINSTYEPNLSIMLKNAIIDDLRLEPNIEVTTDKSNAQAYLKTEIISFTATPTAFNASGFASIYSCVISVKLSLIAKNGAKLLPDKVLTASTNYSIPANTNINSISSIESAKLLATKSTIADLASLIREELFMSSGF